MHHSHALVHNNYERCALTHSTFSLFQQLKDIASMILHHKIHQKTTLIYYIVYHAIGKNINSIQNEIVVLFADTGNAASGYRNPDSIENEVR